MADTLDPLAPSVNNSPMLSPGVLSRLRSRFKRTPPISRPSGDGYVEFGEFRSERPGLQKVGTFAGVFCPVVLSMFSALIFIRMGYLVGNAGLLVTLAQFGLAYLIVAFTVTSICAISTNGAIEGGGVYFMISRTLGPELGGAIGSLFFLANVVSSALCHSACAEALLENFGPGGYLAGDALPDGAGWRLLYRSALNALALAVSLAGAALFARTSLAIWITVLVCLASSLLSFFLTPAKEIALPLVNHLVNISSVRYTGLSASTLSDNLYPEYGRDYSTAAGDQVNFAAVFGVLFTGVTGVMAGANMSGELRHPASSIPRGTLAALVFTALGYVLLALLSAASCPRELLQNHYLYLLPINVWPPFITIGMLVATFSAGLSNLIGASRVLEALARDDIYGRAARWLVPSAGRGPTLAVLSSGVLVQLGVCAGSLNAIAQVNSVLFITSYFAVNLACLGLELASTPNFRPTFRGFSWVTCAVGLAGCAGTVFALRPLLALGAAVAAATLVLALHVLSPAAASARWGSLSQALIFHQVRKYLLLLDERRVHVKFWRPQMLLLVGRPAHQAPLIHFVNLQKKGGLFVLGHVRVGELDGGGDPLAAEHQYWLKLIDHLKVKAFVELSLASSVRAGAAQLARLAGLGAMKPDTVLLAYRDHTRPIDYFREPGSRYRTDVFDRAGAETAFDARPAGGGCLSSTEYVQIVADVLCVDKNVCLCRHFDKLDMADIECGVGPQFVDVWAGGLVPVRGEGANGGGAESFSVRGLFALQLAAVVRSARSWTRMKLRLRTVCPPRPSHADTDGDRSAVGDADQFRGRLQELLKLLRIDATVHVETEWPPLDHHKETIGPDSSSSDEEEYSRVPIHYLQSVNVVLRARSADAALLFIQLPPPPSVSNNTTTSTAAESYMRVMDELTKDLPPTIMVRGLKSVTSIAL